jgi:transaldolase
MLAREEIKINVTAVFTWEQMHTSSVVLAEAGIDSIISVFAGRIFDTGADAEAMLKRFTTTHKTPSNVKMLWASPREVYNVVQAARCGCDVITLFPKFIERLAMFGKSLEEYSRETAEMFARDAKEAGYTL